MEGDQEYLVKMGGGLFIDEGERLLAKVGHSEKNENKRMTT